MGWNGVSRADIAYAYAEQTMTGITVTGTGLAGATMTGTATSAAAVVSGGAGDAHANPTDTLQAYAGAAPPAPQNSYVKYATSGGGTQAGDFSRGDAVLSGTSLFTTAGMNTSNVAETQVSTAGSGNGLGIGSGSWSIAGTFNTTGTSVTVSYNWANDIVAMVAGGIASAESSFKVSITIKDQHGHSIDASPAELNEALSAPPNGPELITTGTGSTTLSLAGLTAGDVFGIAISGTELSSGQLTASVPEPGSMALAGLGGALVLAFQAYRRRTRKV
jgi:hypothetical protein